MCFFLFATDGARPPSVAVLFVQHDLIANVTVYRTYSDSTQISKLVALFLENGISPLMQQCLSEIFGSDRPRTADLEFVGDGNCSIVSGNDLNLSAYGYDSSVKDAEGGWGCICLGSFFCFALFFLLQKQQLFRSVSVTSDPQQLTFTCRFSLRSTSALREFYELRTPTIGAIPSETRQVVGLKKVCDVFCGVSEPGLLDFRYLSITRCKVMQGPLPTYGIGQFDHQWGKMSRSGPRDWMWFNCWLPDGRDVLFYQVGKQDPQVRVVDVDGTTRSLECTTKVQSTWVSPRTLVAYAQHLIVTTTEFEVSVRPSFVDMEVETSLCVGGLFEGPAKCVFTGVGRSGPLEHLGFLPPVSCEAFIEIAAPTHLHQRFFRDHFENMQETIGPQISLLLGDLDEKQYIDVLGLPPSNLVDARGVLSYNRDYAKVMQYGLGGGSTWRSAMMVIATRMLTSSRSAVNAAVLLCPLLEVYHTASLMIDDIQDRSEKRRGKPCAYKTFGENKTLLAALTSTTLWTDVIDKCGLPDTTSYALCSLQGKAMRQLYLGQLQDVSDSDDLGLRRRDIEQLCSDPPRTNEIEHRIMGMHALKTGSAVAFALSVAGVLAEKHSIIGVVLLRNREEGAKDHKRGGEE